MKTEKRFYLNIFYVVIGAALLVCGVFEIVDSFWSGMGGALIGVGAIRIFQFEKIRKNPEYREKMDIEYKDERNQFIRLRAWAWSGYTFVILNALGTIAFKIAGNESLSIYCSSMVCIVLVLYWVCYLILRKKY